MCVVVPLMPAIEQTRVRLFGDGIYSKSLLDRLLLQLITSFVYVHLRWIGSKFRAFVKTCLVVGTFTGGKIEVGRTWTKVFKPPASFGTGNLCSHA